MITRIFPFLTWFSGYDRQKARADIISGVTVALVLIPQSMAYAQLAGLPPYYGLYASFLPPMLAALFGSSRQLATGPVAVVSLMTSASLAPLATAGSEGYIAYAILLALAVGVFQLLLGVLRLGLVVNFLSHPVVNGFTNAAAIIIATSQLSKLFGVSVDNAKHHYETIIRVVESAMVYTHWPTFFLGALAFAIMYGIRRWNPRIPYVLVAVVITTIISATTGFEKNAKAVLADFPGDVSEKILAYNQAMAEIEKLSGERTAFSPELEKTQKEKGADSIEATKASHRMQILNMDIAESTEEAGEIRSDIRRMLFVQKKEADGRVLYAFRTEADGKERVWRIKVGNKKIAADEIPVFGGGQVVGKIPRGLPAVSAPKLNLSILLKLLPYAAIISLLGFMEAISIAKAMASKTGQRLDPNQELIGQGIANIVGAFAKSYPVSGSFSRSAVNLQSGAVTGLSSVVTSVAVVITLLFFTPLLYSLPQSVLAAVIMMAVVGLLNVSGFVHAWRAQWYDGAISIVSFLATLAFAPHLDKGIMVGVVLSLGVFLYKSMRPTVATLALHPDLSYRDARHYGLVNCRHIAVVRFDGPLFFANASFLEDQISGIRQRMPELRHILIVANGINDMDASGEETLSLLVDRLRSGGVQVSFSGIKENVMAVFQRTHLYENIGRENIYPLQAAAIDAIWEDAHRGSDEEDCPLRTVCVLPEAMTEALSQELHRLARVLVVDDEREFVENLAERLKLRDFGPKVAYDGEMALCSVADDAPDVMLLDLRMPGVDGFSVLSQVKKEHPGVEVIILTGQGSREDERKALSLGAFAYLEKPVSIEKLTDVMEQAYAKVSRIKKGQPEADRAANH
ncbi:MAG: SulP family inorganic anion transporter [Thermodesulfobacteriota bacterium]